MAERRGHIQKVRASRDGHEYHETWTARHALQLLHPDTDLIGIAVEGLSSDDASGAPSATINVADTTLYYGNNPTFDEATRTIVTQFKYSIASKDRDFRASDAKDTIEKFGETYRDYKKRYGPRPVEQRLAFRLVTNQPVSPSLLAAIDSLASDTRCCGDIGKQATQFQTASGLQGKPLRAFARKVEIAGSSGGLLETKHELASLLVDWSTTNDTRAAARLGDLKDLVRRKAGSGGADNNLIVRADVLAVLGISEPADLLPCESHFVNVDAILERKQLGSTLACIQELTVPLLIQATGGVGKTVFMRALAHRLSESHEVVLFDCFGGGAYRSPDDARHLSRIGLIHVANTLAFRGLCDPMLPGPADVPELFRTFRRRLCQCLATLARIAPKRQIALLLDAIDNAHLAAQQNRDDCFPVLLLESLTQRPIDGIKIIVSSRPERKPPIHTKCQELTLRAFSKEETATFVRSRLRNAGPETIAIAHARSRGNPRVLDYVLNSGPEWLDPEQRCNAIELDALIDQRISDSIETAVETGWIPKDVDVFLGSLVMLPPPVPVEECAAAQGVAVAVIESFASDLHPLLERTTYGLSLRDEPTETLLHRRYASSAKISSTLVSNLLERQGESVYAARALPGLLYRLRDTRRLVALAFDGRIPKAITSTVGKRRVQRARLTAAIVQTAEDGEYGHLVRLLLKRSSIATADQRGLEYILDHPELVGITHDAEIKRRVFETRTAWPGTRHACLAIVNTLSGDSEEAQRNARLTREWVAHHAKKDEASNPGRSGPGYGDIAAIALVLVANGRGRDAVRYAQLRHEGHAFEVCRRIVEYVTVAQAHGYTPRSALTQFVEGLSRVGPLAAAVSSDDLSITQRRETVVRLARRCRRVLKRDVVDAGGENASGGLQAGLRKGAVVALSLGLTSEALAISARASHGRPSLTTVVNAWHGGVVVPFVFRIAIRAAARKKDVHEKDVLPTELAEICAPIRRQVTGSQFVERAETRMDRWFSNLSDREKQTRDEQALRRRKKRDAGDFLGGLLAPILGLARALSAVLSADTERVGSAYVALIEEWESAWRGVDAYWEHTTSRFLWGMGFEVAAFVLYCRSDLERGSARRFLQAVEASTVGPHELVRIVAILAQREALRDLAGELAAASRARIEAEDDTSRRASLFGDLSRAMLGASRDEALAYFRTGLDEMDAIGSGDYSFTNEAVLFAAELKGQELDEQSFHTLTNLCELSLGDEAEKFPWGAYGRGISRVAGLRGLAKLSRWHARSTIGLEHTLLPYLTGLLDCGKISARDALALNRLARASESYYPSTKDFIQAVGAKANSDPVTMAELVEQFLDEYPTLDLGETTAVLASFAEGTLDPESESYKSVHAARMRYDEQKRSWAERHGTGWSESDFARDRAARKRKHAKAVEKIAATTDPVDDVELARAIDAVDALDNVYDLKGDLAARFRERVPYGERHRYVRAVATLENVSIQWKLSELKETWKAWTASSAALSDEYRRIVGPLIRQHTTDVIHSGYSLGARVQELSELTGVAPSEIARELIYALARQDGENRTIDGSTWMACARFICNKADGSQARRALTTLLSDAAVRRADSVADGPLVPGLYPGDDVVESASGMIWRLLGSPLASDRWRAAHCLRSFAKSCRWEVVDQVVRRMTCVDAGAFHAKEVPFFHMHARLWTLIAIARIALDYPEQITRYQGTLLHFVLGEENRHVLMRQFARCAVCACMEAGALSLPEAMRQRVLKANKSPHAHRVPAVSNRGDHWSSRPPDVPSPTFDFGLNYDFHKYDVDSLASVFGLPCWEVADLISVFVQNTDASVQSMYDSGGLKPPNREGAYEFSTRYQTYGQQLGWHGLLVAAGQLLEQRPIAETRWGNGDPWVEWLRGYSLSQGDGLWLSDGTDRTPLNVGSGLLERRGKTVAITGDRNRILPLVGLDDRVRGNLVIHGHWRSLDGVDIGISSILVAAKRAGQKVEELLREEPFVVGVPCCRESEEDEACGRGADKDVEPWIVCPDRDAGLDERDPYGVSVSLERARLSRRFVVAHSLSRHDAFGRVWGDAAGRPVLRAQAWGRNDTDVDGRLEPGTRLVCTGPLLERTLSMSEKELVILIKLKRSEEASPRGTRRYFHTVAVARINKAGVVTYCPGSIDHRYEPAW